MPLFDNQECQLNVDLCVHMEETNHSHFYILYPSLFLFISLLESTLIWQASTSIDLLKI